MTREQELLLTLAEWAVERGHAPQCQLITQTGFCQCDCKLKELKRALQYFTQNVPS